MSGERAPSSLCLVPWIHAHVDAQGISGPVLHGHGAARRSRAAPGRELRSLLERCPDARRATPDALRRTARAMPLCRGDGNRSQSLKDEIAERWPGREPEIIAATDADGATTLRPFTFDLSHLDLQSEVPDLRAPLLQFRRSRGPPAGCDRGSRDGGAELGRRLPALSRHIARRRARRNCWRQ